MGSVKPSVRLLYAWWTMLFAAVILLCLAALPLAEISRTLWLTVTIGLLVAFSVLFGWYLPARYRSLSYKLCRETIVKRSGVLVMRERFLYVKNIQFAFVEVTLLDMIFDTYTLCVRSAGVSLALRGLEQETLAAASELYPVLFAAEDIPKKPERHRGG